MLNLNKIREILGARLVGDGNCEIEQLSIDSRTIKQGESILFIAISGQQNNGHNYIDHLIRSGHKNFLVEEGYPTDANANFVIVKDSVDALQKLATYKRSEFKSDVIAITGSNGKTIVKEWLATCLGVKIPVIKSPKSYNSQVGVPLSVWPLNNNYKAAIIEAGISFPGEMNKLQSVIKPTIGVFTTLGDAHQQNFTSLKEKLNEKLNLFENAQAVVYNSDETLVKQAMLARFRQFSLGYSSKDHKAFVYFNEERIIDGNACFKFNKEQKKYQLKFHLTDPVSLANIKPVITFLCYLKYEQHEMQDMINKVEPVSMRLELLKGRQNCTIINDTYNSDVNSIKIAIDMLNRQVQHKEKLVIISDVFQTGENKEAIYKSISKLLNEDNLHFIGIGNEISRYKGLFSQDAHFYTDTQQFLNDFNIRGVSNTAVLLKGARKFHFEQICNRLVIKQHRTQLEINYNALQHNLNYYRSKLNPKTKILAMVKALGYGSGSTEIASMLQHSRVDYLGVAYADEGVELRHAGITLPVLVMNASELDFSSIVENNLEPEIYSISLLQKFQLFIEKQGLLNYPVHLKIETGMHRLGIEQNDLEKINFDNIKDILKIKSLFTHLAAADTPEHDAFTITQFNKFEDSCKIIEQKLDYKPFKHVLNSAGIDRFAQYQYDMVRLGIGLYGESGLNNNLQPIGKFKTLVSQVKTVPKGETIGYSRNGKAISDKVIAILPVGYADGINRKLGNGNISFYLNGSYVPTIGNICMDMCMVDITGVKANENDEVIIFGKENPISKIAEVLETIPYEILTSVSSRVKKVYIHE